MVLFYPKIYKEYLLIASTMLYVFYPTVSFDVDITVVGTTFCPQGLIATIGLLYFCAISISFPEIYQYSTLIFMYL